MSSPKMLTLLGRSATQIYSRTFLGATLGGAERSRRIQTLAVNQFGDFEVKPGTAYSIMPGVYVRAYTQDGRKDETVAERTARNTAEFKARLKGGYCTIICAATVFKGSPPEVEGLIKKIVEGKPLSPEERPNIKTGHVGVYRGDRSFADHSPDPASDQEDALYKFASLSERQQQKTATYVIEVRDDLMPPEALERMAKGMSEPHAGYNVSGLTADNCATWFQRIIFGKEPKTKSPLLATSGFLQWLIYEHLPDPKKRDAALATIENLGFNRSLLEVAADEKRYAAGVPFAAASKVEELETAMESTDDDRPMDDLYDPDVADAMLAGLSPELVKDPPKPGDDAVEQEENGIERTGPKF